MNQKGFTLVEILTVVIIIAVLVVMAVPLYEKAIERSHVAEARAVLKQMLESKLNLMEDMHLDSFSIKDGVGGYLPPFGISRLDLSIKCTPVNRDTTSCQTKSFRYTIFPQGVNFPAGVSTVRPNDRPMDAVCAARCGGDYHNTAFLYMGELVTNSEKMICTSSDKEACKLYGMENINEKFPWCTCD